ncbi:hypothetical protein [Fischerella sp. PCC 9605]|uniref:hypothetical protein n=1 Tax=Fischerella sp. PCC 9605 TaxID=1173024 RepID=UPI00047A73F0|nr:hypothetical protein [Fischerella sp. PCC 9605]
MAASIRASEQGLQIVDQARRKKGWTKTEEAWYGLALTSKATLKRFWLREPIQQEIFMAICKAVGIDDWEAIADFSSQSSEGKQSVSSFTSPRPLVLDGSITQDEVNKILRLFSTRDAAVLDKNTEKFLGTQLNMQEIKGGYSNGYISCSKMTTSVLQIEIAEQNQATRDIACNPGFFSDREFDVDYVVEVREDYEHNNKPSHSGFISYFLRKADKGFKIVNLRSRKEGQLH